MSLRTLLVAVGVEAPADWADEDVMDGLRWKQDVPGPEGPCEYQSGFETLEILTMYLKENATMTLPITVSIPGDDAVSGLDASATLVAKMKRQTPSNWTLVESSVVVTDVDGRWVGHGHFVHQSAS